MSALSELRFINTIRERFSRQEAVNNDLQTLLQNPENHLEIFDLLETLLPQFPLTDFEKCVTNSLSKFLDRSRDFSEKQMYLAFHIGQRYLREKNLKRDNMILYILTSWLEDLLKVNIDKTQPLDKSSNRDVLAQPKWIFFNEGWYK